MSTDTPEQVVAANLAAYNARDLDAFMRWFADDIEFWDQQTGARTLQGQPQVRAVYGEVFANSPDLHSHVVRRACVGNVVIDHEIVTGRYGGDLEILISYQVLAGRISRVWVSRAPLAGVVRVRAARAADVAGVVAIGRSTYEEYFAHIWSAAGLQAHLNREFDPVGVAGELGSAQVSYFLAESGSGVIGFAKLRHPRPVPVERALIGAELQKIYVEGVTLKRGIGAQLLDACVARASELGHAVLWLDVLERNIQATCFYLRHGFKFAGKESFQTDRQAETMLVMTRVLSE